jgi:hypothetical protein
MKKLILSVLILGTSIVAVPSIEAKTTSATSAVDPQIRVQIGRNNRRYNRRWERRRMRRVVTTTRIRRIGFRTYRETIRTTYLPNGTTRTVVINRERIRG